MVLDVFVPLKVSLENGRVWEMDMLGKLQDPLFKGMMGNINKDI